MKIKPFAVEEWMNEYEDGARFNIAETCVDSVSLDELFQLTGQDKKAFLDEFSARRLTYGAIWGAPAFKEGICKLYKTISPEHVVTTHGAAGANHHVFYSLVEPGERVVSIMPTYQQLYSIPESFGADVQLLHLRQENDYLPDLDELRRLVTPGTKMICINNPNNPTGALMSTELLYDKGISVSSMSKVFSLAGLRLGWIASHDMEAIKTMLSHRDYNLVSCGMFDEAVAGLALAHSDKMLERNRGIVRENLAILDAWVASEPRLTYTKPQAGTTALVYYDYDLPSYEFCERMYHETGAFVTPGNCFEQPHSVRIGYASDTQVLKDGLNAFSAFLRTLEQK